MENNIENKNIVLGPKDPKNPDYYLHLVAFLQKKMQWVSRAWWLLDFKYNKTGEVLSYKQVHFRREYVNEVAQCLANLDFDSLVNIPREKDGCAFRLDFRYVKSGKMVGMQLWEIRENTKEVFFYVTPAIVLLEEEGEKAYKQLKPML